MTKAETDAEREIRNPGTGNRTAGGRQSECLGLVVEFAPVQAGAGPSSSSHRIDANALHGS